MERKYLVTEYGVIPDHEELQTEKIQSVLDLCKDAGGTVVIPRGTYRIAGLWLWSDTTLYLEAGATLVGSDDCNDYTVFPIPEGVEMQSDLETIPEYFETYAWGEERRGAYRRAMISSYGQKNIRILGESDSTLNGSNCYDPDGEEGYMGPHIIFLSDCQNVELRGYTSLHSGNFHHEADNCDQVRIEGVISRGGCDGFHIHGSRHVTIVNCDLQTGDDCVAGVNVWDLLVKNCRLNTSCSPFRIGGVDIRVEDCEIYGPGVYPWRKSVVLGKNKYLPREAGRHNTVNLIEFFASTVYPVPVPCHIRMHNCVIEGIDRLLFYRHGTYIQTGQNLTRWDLDNVVIRNIKNPSVTIADPEEPFYIHLHNVTVEDGDFKSLMDVTDPHTHILEH
ncbi:MAG: hypothetical protein IKZ21_06450 [Clostridia bacterium]|nr:hypothetical protein [Clostridia bacterium]